MNQSLKSDFIILELPLEDSPGKMQAAIETALNRRGMPLRWAVTAVDAATHIVRVEAIVTQALVEPQPISCP